MQYIFIFPCCLVVILLFFKLKIENSSWHQSQIVKDIILETSTTVPPDTTIIQTEPAEDPPVTPGSGPNQTCPVSLKESLRKNNTNITKNTKFLLPVLKWGPTNQILGFYESKKVAQHLNAKLVFAPFYLAKTDENFVQSKLWEGKARELTVPAKLRLNIADFNDENSGIETATLNDFRKHCSKRKNIAILLTDPHPYYHWSRIKLFEHVVNIKLIKRINFKGKNLTFYDDLKFFPSLDFYRKTWKPENLQDQTWIKKNWQKYYIKAAQSGRKCFILFTPYHSIGKSETDDTDIPMDADFSKPIKAIEKAFEEKFGKLDIGLHWRYNSNDKEDWARRCTEDFVKFTHRENPPECNYMEKLSYKKVAENLIKRVSSSKTGQIYIAAPPRENTTITKIINHAKTINNSIKFLYLFDLLKVIKSEFNTCKWLRLYKGEIISLAEQAILSSSKEFIYFSIDSSWGRRIIDRRVKLKEENFQDESFRVSYILDILKNSLEEK